MNEHELFKVVHDYASWLSRPLGSDMKRKILTMERAKLLAAIDAYAQDRIAKLPSPLATLLAKAAVCDAYAEAHALIAQTSVDKSDQRHEWAEDKIQAAWATLRKLQENQT